MKTAYIGYIIVYVLHFTLYSVSFGIGKVQQLKRSNVRGSLLYSKSKYGSSRTNSGYTVKYGYERPQAIIPVKNLAHKTVYGDGVIICRNFKIDTPKTFNFIGSYKSLNSMPIFPLPEVAFLGRSNVGKSSLLNCLTGLNKKVAVEGKTPGRTQSINVFSCRDKMSDICMFIDLPGYGYAKISRIQQDEISRFIRDYLLARKALKLAVLLVDCRRDIQRADMDMLEFLYKADVPTLVVATKLDLLKKSEIHPVLTSLHNAYGRESTVVPFSAFTGHGIRDVWKYIREGLLEQSSEAEEEEHEQEHDDDDDDSNQSEECY